MKDKELRREAVIQRTMCEGICDRCREKLQWRFKYDKYKPLTKPGNCQKCRNKTVTKAYRIYCDNCASADGICASCTGNLKQLRQERLAMLEEKEGLANKKAGNEEDDLDDAEDQDVVDMAYDRDESIGEQDEHNDANEKEMDTEIDTQDGEHLTEDNSQTAGIAFLQANFASDRNLRIIEKR